jgi:nicotinate-nucleotide adenylyltransferase
MNIGIFGGTFNPIHIAHLYIAEEIRESMGLDEVVFVPSSVPPHKEVEYKVSAERRLKMVELAVEGNPAFKVSDMELKLPIPSYSIKTVERFQEQYGEKAKLYFITGMDSFLDVVNWHGADRLITLCDFVTTFRPGTRHVDLAKHKYVREIDVVLLDELDQRVRCVGRVEMTSGRYLWLVASLGMEVSSTEIRKRLKARRGVKYLLPEKVESYIIQNRLYI